MWMAFSVFLCVGELLLEEYFWGFQSVVVLFKLESNMDLVLFLLQRIGVWDISSYNIGPKAIVSNLSMTSSGSKILNAFKSLRN